MARTHTEALEVLKGFVGRGQLHVMVAGCRGEEGNFFREKIQEMAERIATTPVTYQQRDAAEPVAHLHYFLGGCDWYILEKDVDSDGEGQHQAFGWANLGDDQNAELGYISIPEILAHHGELDLHFRPRALAEITAHV